MIDQDKPQPSRYDHDYQNVDGEEIPDDRGSLRVALWVISAALAVVMVAYPVIQVIDWDGDDDDSGADASDARAFVAARFATDAFVRLSADDAAGWALPNLRDEIETIVSDLQQRPAGDRSGAAVSLARVECDDAIDSDSECFHAWARKPGAVDLIRVLLVVGIVNGDARVIDVERVNVV